MTKKKITSTEDQGEIEVPLKKQKVPENSTEEFVIQEKKKKRKKSETKTLDEFSGKDIFSFLFNFSLFRPS